MRTLANAGATIGHGLRGLRPCAPVLLSLTSLVFYAAACALPIVRATVLGQHRDGLLMSGVASLWSEGHWALACVVVVFGFLAPCSVLVCSLGAFGALAASREPSAIESRWGDLSASLQHWAMPEVQVLGVLVAFTKLSHLVPSEPAEGLLCYGLAALFTLGAWRSYEKQRPREHRPRTSTHRRDALLLAVSALVLLVPAYSLPFMAVDRMGHTQADTIFTSVQKLWHQGMWGIALIVFTASLLVPVLKLTGMAYLLAISGRPNPSNASSAKLHAWVHFVGRWSMLDIFLVAFLCGVVRFPGVAVITPGPGALAFSLACILTILSTLTFDPRCLDVPTTLQREQK